MELIMKTDLEKSMPAVLDFNYEETKSALAERLKYYTDLVVSEDDIAGAKKDRAGLNKLKTSIEDWRKSVKAQCLAPYEAFEKKCKELSGMVEEASGAIDVQVKAFENAEKEERRAALSEAYGACIGTLATVLPFDRIFSDKWLNRSTPFESAVSELQASIEKVKTELEIISGMKLHCEQEVLDKYLSTLSLASAMAENARIKERDKQLAELNAVNRRAEELGVPLVPAKTAQQVTNIPSPCEELKTIRVVFYDTTQDFRDDMRALTTTHNIKYGGIKE